MQKQKLIQNIIMDFYNTLTDFNNMKKQYIILMNSIFFRGRASARRPRPGTSGVPAGAAYGRARWTLYERGPRQAAFSYCCRTPRRVTMTSTRGSWWTSCSKTVGPGNHHFWVQVRPQRRRQARHPARGHRARLRRRFARGLGAARYGAAALSCYWRPSPAASPPPATPSPAPCRAPGRASPARAGSGRPPG